jgi:hypothetical protein
LNGYAGSAGLSPNHSQKSKTRARDCGGASPVANDRMDRIPIPYVKEDEALAEELRLVVRLDAQSLFRVERSETFL